MAKESIPAQIARLQEMPVSELQEKWRELYGEEPRVKNRVWLWKRLAWRIQELEYGGLSDAAKARLEQLMPTAELALRNPPEHMKEHQPLPSRKIRDPRIPPPGTILLKLYKDQRIAVEVLEDGFSWEGRTYDSLSAIATEATGSRWNGFRFFSLTKGTK